MFGKWLKSQRVEKRLSQFDLVKKVELLGGQLSKAYISRLEHGVAVRPREEVLHYIAKALNVDIDEARTQAGYKKLKETVFPVEFQDIEFEYLDKEDLEILRLLIVRMVVKAKKCKELSQPSDDDFVEVTLGGVAKEKPHPKTVIQASPLTHPTSFLKC